MAGVRQGPLPGDDSTARQSEKARSALALPQARHVEVMR